MPILEEPDIPEGVYNVTPIFCPICGLHNRPRHTCPMMKRNWVNADYMELLKTAYESYINGNREQMCDQIDDYGAYYFWNDLRLSDVLEKDQIKMVCSYFAIRHKNDPY